MPATIADNVLTVLGTSAAPDPESGDATGLTIEFRPQPEGNAYGGPSGLIVVGDLVPDDVPVAADGSFSTTVASTTDLGTQFRAYIKRYGSVIARTRAFEIPEGITATIGQLLPPIILEEGQLSGRLLKSARSAPLVVSTTGTSYAALAGGPEIAVPVGAKAIHAELAVQLIQPPSGASASLAIYDTDTAGLITETGIISVNGPVTWSDIVEPAAGTRNWAIYWKVTSGTGSIFGRARLSATEL